MFDGPISATDAGVLIVDVSYDFSNVLFRKQVLESGHHYDAIIDQVEHRVLVIRLPLLDQIGWTDIRSVVCGRPIAVVGNRCAAKQGRRPRRTCRDRRNS